MKIGILTIHNAINYGSALQAYAMQKYISSIDKTNHVYIIDYRIHRLETMYKPKLFKSYIVKKLKAFKIKTALIELKESYFDRRIKKVMNKGFKSFWRNYNLICRNCYSYKDIQKEEFDIIFCGSDQIWNESIVGRDINVFLLDFNLNKTKRFAYAASGLALLDNNIIRKLESFDSIGIRESDAFAYINKYFPNKSQLVIDPTFLLDKFEWDKFTYNIKGKYIFEYLLYDDETCISLGENLAEKYNLQIIKLNRLTNKARITLNNGKQKILKTNRIDTFLSLIKHAEFVITNSFHGTAFSIIFEKDFYSVKHGSGNRQLTLLNEIGLEDRFIENICEEKDKINYVDARKRIHKFIKSSQDFIKEALFE